MRIRKQHWIKDRLKILAILLLLLGVLVWLIFFGEKSMTQEKESSISTLIQTAMQPVGKTMYIWGGGWDDADDAAGAGATRIGMSMQWEAFAKKQGSDYDFNKYRLKREKGLDCSGYVGWTLYNTFEEKDGEAGYVTTSTDMAKSLAKRGWGKLIKNPKHFLPGDIVSMKGHVWICLGTCKDGSVLLVHSSPPGVSVCGTPSKREAVKDGESQAVKLAREYMSKNHPLWQEKYPNREVPLSYLEEVTVFRWSKKVMRDAEELQSISAEELFVYMFGEV